MGEEVRWYDMPNYSEHIKFLREGKPTESELKVLRSEKEYFCSCQTSTLLRDQSRSINVQTTVEWKAADCNPGQKNDLEMKIHSSYTNRKSTDYTGCCLPPDSKVVPSFICWSQMLEYFSEIWASPETCTKCVLLAFNSMHLVFLLSAFIDPF